MLSSATHLLACSVPAGSLFGTGWRRHAHAKLVYYGVDFAGFDADAAAQRESARREFGIRPSQIVIGHVGGLSPAKNHAFLAAIAAAALEREPRICVLCVGDGRLRQKVQAHFERTGVRVIFAGLRSDVPRLLRAMDVFAFPSLHEGLPLALLEAQAAGLPAVVSSEITREAEVVPGLFRWLPLTAGAGVWADAVLAAAGQSSQPAAPAVMRASRFSIETSFEHMRSIYCA